MPHSSCGASVLGDVGKARAGFPGEGQAELREEMRVIDAAQQAVEEAEDASVSPGAGRVVNMWRRSTHSITSVHPRMVARDHHQGPVDPSSPEQVSHLPGGRAPSLGPGRRGGRTGGGERGCVVCARDGQAQPARGKHQQK